MKQKSISAFFSTRRQFAIPGVSAALVFSFAGMFSSASAQWLATPADDVFNNTANWTGGTVNGTFSGSSSITTLTVGANQATNISFNNANTVSYILGTSPGAGNFIYGSGGTVSTTTAVTASQIINAGIFTAAGRTTPMNFAFTASGTSGSTLTLNGPVTGSMVTAGLSIRLDLRGSGYGIINGIVSDGVAGGSLTLARTGGAAQSAIWELNGANTFSGGLEFGNASGSVALGNKNALGTGAIRTSTGSGTFLAVTDLTGANAIPNTINYTSSTGTASAGASVSYDGTNIGTYVDGDEPVVGQMVNTYTNFVPNYTRILAYDPETFKFTMSANATGTGVSGAPGTLNFKTAPFSSSGGGTISFAGTNNLEFSGTQNLTTVWSTGLAATQTFNVTNTGTTIFSGVLQEQAGVASIAKSGAGTLVLSNTNTYTGANTINAGVLSVSSLANGGVASSIGASASGSNNLVFNGGTLLYTGSGSNTDRRFDLRGSFTIDASGTGPLKFDAGVGFNNGNFGPLSARTLTLTGSNTGDNTILPNILDSGTAPDITSISKTGAGTWILGGVNNFYTGPTSVTEGTLLINGNISSQAVTVSSGAKLGGSGTIINSVSVASGGGLAFVVNTDVAGHNSLDISDTLTLSGSTNLTILGGSNAEVGTYVLVTAANPIVGTLPTLNMPLLGGISATLDFASGNTQLVLIVDAVAANDYTTWVESFTSPEILGADQLSTADPDKDGLTNQQEYAFGLIPNSGSSVNPIVAQVSGGKFSYTRRTLGVPTPPLVYTVETSSTLGNDWAVDMGATEMVVTTGDLQTVEVTLSPLLVSSNPKLFVRVVAK